MKEFLKKLKLIDFFTTNLQITKKDFVEGLSAITEDGSTGFFINVFESFSSGHCEYVGQINSEGFKLRRRIRLFENNYYMPVAKGSIIEDQHQLIIATEINGLHSSNIFTYAILIIAYSSFLIAIISTNSPVFFGATLVLVTGVLFFVLTYFGMRGAMKRFKYQLERDFFFLTKKD